MANERRPNSVNGSVTVNKLAELASRYSNRVDTPSSPEFDILSQIGGLSQARNKILGSPNGGSTPENAQNLSNIESRIEGLFGRLEPIENRRINTATKGYVSAAETTLRASNIRADVNGLSRSTSVLGAAAGSARLPTYELENRQQSAAAGVAAGSARLRDAIRNDPSNSSVINALQNELGSSIHGSAVAESAIDFQRKSKMDIRSRIISSQERQGRLANTVYGADLAAGVEAGAYGTRAKQEDILRSSLNDIGLKRSERENTTDPKKIEELQAAIDKLTHSAEGAADVLGEMKRQGTGGGMGGKFRRGLQYAAMGAEFGANLVDTWSYENPMRERQNQIRYAEIQNHRYDDTRNALNGDMGSLRRLGSVYGRASELNDSTKAWSRASTGLNVVPGIVGGALEMGTGTPIGKVAGAFTMAKTINNAAANWNQQAGERGSALASLDIQRSDTLNYVRDSTSQSFVDFSRTLGQATIGAGGLRGAAFDQVSSSPMLARLARVGIDPTRAAGLTGMGINATGRQFSGNNLEAAGQFERGGYGSAEQYFQSLGKMGNVSGNSAGSLQEILKNAVALGMDNSKNIEQMVDATSSIASRSASMGLDTSIAATQLLAKGAGGLGDTVTENMRTAAAMSAVDFANRAAGDTGLTVNTVAEQAGINKYFPGASQPERMSLAHLNQVKLQALRGPEGVKTAQQLGLDNLLLKTDSNGQQIVDQNALKNLDREIKRPKVVNDLVGYGISEGVRKRALAAGSFDDLSKKDQIQLNAIAAAKDLNAQALFGTIQANNQQQGLPKTSSSGGAGSTDDILKASAEGQLKVLEEGRKVVGTLDNVAMALKEVAGKFDPERMGKAVSDAADHFNVPFNKFDKAVDRLVAKLDVLDGRSRK